ncbi:hypothetical protein JCM8547_005903 [Rhodosporidiobolus lusitaniae]
MASSRGPSSPGPAAPSSSFNTTTITRSMSRRSLAEAGLLPSSASNEMPAPPVPTRVTVLPRSRTTSTFASSSSLSSSRTASSLSRPSASSLASGKSATSLPTSRSRRVLLPSNKSSSAAGSLNTTSAAKSRPAAARRAQRLSREDAAQMKGMGVVRAGPAVQGRSPSKSRSASQTGEPAADPFSTAFVRPTFHFEVSAVRGGAGVAQEKREVRPLPSSETVEGRRRKLSGEKSDGSDKDERVIVENELDAGFLAIAANPFDLTSPTKKRSASSSSFLSGGMDVDPSSHLLPIPASSPIRHALSPRTLTGRTPAAFPSAPSAARAGEAGASGSLRRKLVEISSSDEVDRDDDEDDIDFLSPRKKKAKRPLLWAPSPVAVVPSSSAAPSFPPPSRSTALPSPIPMTREPARAASLLRSPPPKKKLPSSATVRASVAAAASSLPVPSAGGEMPRSTVMQRSSGRTFPLPDLTSRPLLPTTSAEGSRLSRSQAAPSLSSSVSSTAQPANRILPSSLTRSTRSSTNLANLSSSTSTAPPYIPSSSRLPRAAMRIVPSATTITSSSTSSSTALPAAPPPSASSSFTSTSNLPLTSSIPSTTPSAAKSEETARRLANLQSMLSRLQMPASRRTSGGGAASETSVASVSMSTVGDVSMPGGGGGQRDYTVPLAPPGESSSSTGTRRPITSSSSAPAPAMTRRRSSSGLPTAQRAAGGIVNTANSAGESSFSFTASSSMPALPSFSRRRSSVANSSSSFSLDQSLILPGLSELVNEGTGGEGGGPGKPKNPLRGVVAFVDVRTAEGDDSGMIFVDMLKGLGARVTLRPSSLTTHIIYKSGRPSTLSFLRSLPPTSRPKLVGIAWVVRCAELGQKVDEAAFGVPDVGGAGGKEGKENVGAAKRGGRQSEEGGKKVVGQKREVGEMAQAALGMGSGPSGKGGAAAGKRRRSMEPKALAALNNSMNASSSAAAENALKASIAASIDRARRKSLQYAPKVGSPLAKRVFVMPDVRGAEQKAGRMVEEEDENEGMQE